MRGLISKETVSLGVKRLRGIKNLTQEELARRMGVKISYAQKIEAAKHFHRIDTMDRVARAFDMSLTEFIEFITVKEK